MKRSLNKSQTKLSVETCKSCVRRSSCQWTVQYLMKAGLELHWKTKHTSLQNRLLGSVRRIVFQWPNCICLTLFLKRAGIEFSMRQTVEQSEAWWKDWRSTDISRPAATASLFRDPPLRSISRRSPRATIHFTCSILKNKSSISLASMSLERVSTPLCLKHEGDATTRA